MIADEHHPRLGGVFGVQQGSRLRFSPELFSKAYQKRDGLSEKQRNSCRCLESTTSWTPARPGLCVSAGHQPDVLVSAGLKPVEDAASVPVITGEEETAFRHCTEALVDVCVRRSMRKRSLRAGSVWDSLIVNNQNGRLKIHLHTNALEQPYGAAGKYGPFIEQRRTTWRCKTTCAAVGGSASSRTPSPTFRMNTARARDHHADGRDDRRQCSSRQVDHPAEQLFSRGWVKRMRIPPVRNRSRGGFRWRRWRCWITLISDCDQRRIASAEPIRRC